MSGFMYRRNDVATYTVTNAAATSPRIPFGGAAGGILVVPTGSITGGATTITWHIATGPEATAVPLSESGAAVTTTIAAGNSYALPDALFAAPFVVAVTNQGSAAVSICVKA